MFDAEAGLLAYQKKEGRRRAVELVADINRWTTLYGSKDLPTENVRTSLGLDRVLFDYNEHFIEMSIMGEEDRSMMFMLLGLFGLMIGLAAFFWGLGLSMSPVFSTRWLGALFIGGGIMAGAVILLRALWPQAFAPNFFTALRARYRFNRTTGKVYVLRPARYGGNVVLDWSRVKAHVNWCAPREMTWQDLDYPTARKARQTGGGGPAMMRGLVLYWPPLDSDDPERKGEEVLWVGPRAAGEGLWQYIRTFMEEGIDAVPEPKHYNWLRKGFQTPGQHLEETQLGPSRALEEVTGESRAMTTAVAVSAAPWTPLHSLAERLCYWPTFPEEWNSDCGQKRRENGIGPEEPLQWAVLSESTKPQ